jgi:hypothetical protein
MTGIRFAYRTLNVSSSKKSVYRCNEYVLRRSTVLTFFFFFFFDQFIFWHTVL